MTGGFIAPQLATLVSDPPAGREWLHEVKFDGYRIACVLSAGRARLISRRGLDWTARFRQVAAAAGALPARRAVLDGEVVALRPDGRSSFQALQRALAAPDAPEIVYYAFDLLRLGADDLRPLPLEQRKLRLLQLLKSGGRRLQHTVRYSDHVAGSGARVLARACRMGLEGIVSKQRDAPYRSGRSRSWLKIKCSNRQEFVVVGFTDPRGARTGLGALLLAVYGSEGQLHYAGKVGTGMGGAMLDQLRARLAPLRRKTAPIGGRVAPGLGGAHWVEPRIVVEVSFTEWTADGRLRHPSFVGIREDKPARQVRRERPAR